MLVNNNKLAKIQYNNKLENNSSFKTFKCGKFKLNSINKSSLIPIFNSKSTLSTSMKTNNSLGKIASKKFENKIETFKIGKNPNTIKEIQSYRQRGPIRLNLINNSNYNKISKNNSRKFTPLILKNMSKNLSSISISRNNYKFNKIININENSSSLIKSFDTKDILFASKKENNPINSFRGEVTIKIENTKIKSKELKSIFKKNSNKNIKITDKKKPENKIILKPNISRRIFLSKYKKVDIKQKNKEFLIFLQINNKKDKIDEIDKNKKKEIKKNIIIAKRVNEERKQNYLNKNNNDDFKLINDLKCFKRMIFVNNNNFYLEIQMINIGINLIKIRYEISIYGSIVQYFSSKYNFQEKIFHFLRLSSGKNKLKIPSFINKVLKRQQLMRMNLENEINTKKIQYKENVIKNNFIPNFSIINKKEGKRNTQLNSNKFWERYSLLNNIDFFISKKNEKNNISINNKRKSFFKRTMYTNLNRRKSIRRKQILKKEDFLLLKSLIELRKENQFEFEFHKLINIYDINSSDKYGNTLLTYACINGEFYIANYLLNNGANPNCINKYKNTPLHYALSNKYYQIADLLINNNAKDNIKNIYGLTPW